MAVTKNCSAQNNISSYISTMEGCFHMWQTVKLQGLKGQTDETNSQQAHFNEAVQ